MVGMYVYMHHKHMLLTNKYAYLLNMVVCYGCWICQTMWVTPYC